MNLNMAINKYLQEKGISQMFLSKRTGITLNALNLALNNKRNLKADEYIRICDALEVPYDFFIQRTENKTA